MTGGGTIDEPIGRHRSQRTRMAVRADGRPSVTHYRVVQSVSAATRSLKVALETGRTHQIRVHLAHAGFPVIGDPVYGGRRRLAAQYGGTGRAAARLLAPGAARRAARSSPIRDRAADGLGGAAAR